MRSTCLQNGSHLNQIAHGRITDVLKHLRGLLDVLNMLSWACRKERIKDT